MHLKAECFNQNYSENINIVKYYYNLKQLFSIWTYFLMLFIPLMKKFNFQHNYFSLHCHIILQKSFYLMLICCSRKKNPITNVKNELCCLIWYFSGLFDE